MGTSPPAVRHSMVPPPLLNYHYFIPNMTQEASVVFSQAFNNVSDLFHFKTLVFFLISAKGIIGSLGSTLGAALLLIDKQNGKYRILQWRSTQESNQRAGSFSKDNPLAETNWSLNSILPKRRRGDGNEYSVIQGNLLPSFPVDMNRR
ncbi:hypothetical protein AMTR_s00035p00232540 [Amborella trichopoda]|uniref:Uncharacterized protein n=1 Tax=Amborella trichopoda TaxID=13333 RepID=W1PXE3_AMBTC|nr:hypothetical protein AMTR_s00035p00232540 [Amborella trichopoda]